MGRNGFERATRKNKQDDSEFYFTNIGGEGIS